MTKTTDDPRCTSCNAKIIWIKNENGNPVPLDARKHLIYVRNTEGVMEEWVREKEARITHFATCPNASKHSRL